MMSVNQLLIEYSLETVDGETEVYLTGACVVNKVHGRNSMILVHIWCGRTAAVEETEDLSELPGKVISNPIWKNDGILFRGMN